MVSPSERFSNSLGCRNAVRTFRGPLDLRASSSAETSFSRNVASLQEPRSPNFCGNSSFPSDGVDRASKLACVLCKTRCVPKRRIVVLRRCVTELRSTIPSRLGLRRRLGTARSNEELPKADRLLSFCGAQQTGYCARRTTARRGVKEPNLLPPRLARLLCERSSWRWVRDCEVESDAEGRRTIISQ